MTPVGLSVCRADERPRFVKLVRDRIGKFLGSGEVIYEQAGPEQIRDGLRRKLIEEAAEYVVSPCIGELADVYEVVRALALIDLGLPSMLQVHEEAQRKREERGGFDDGIAMFVYTTAPARHEGEHHA